MNKHWVNRNEGKPSNLSVNALKKAFEDCVDENSEPRYDLCYYLFFPENRPDRQQGGQE